jgi:prolyl 4-hydroxylase
VKAIKGDAVMFYSLKPDGELDPTSLHGSCPTLAGNKWSATKWIHVGPFGYNKVLTAARTAVSNEGGCGDKEEQCAEWAYFGECEKNPGFMAVSCRRSCKLCPPAKAGATQQKHVVLSADADIGQ